MNATKDEMARKTKQPEPDRLPSVQVRIPGEIAKALEEIAVEEWTTLPTQIVLAAKMYLAHKRRTAPHKPTGESGGRP